MKLKINIVFLFLLQLGFSQSKSSNFYAGIKLGSNYLIKKDKTSTVSYSSKSRSNYSFFGGYMLSENIGLELGMNYLKNSNGDKHHNTNNYFPYTSFATGNTISMWQIKPTLVISGSYKKINPYSKIAIAIGTSLDVTYYKSHSNPNQIFAVEILPDYTNLEMYGGTPIGLNGVFGFEFKVHKNLHLFTELDFFTMRYNPKYGHYEKFASNIGGYNGFGETNYTYENFFFDYQNNPISLTSQYLNEFNADLTESSIVINNANLNFGVKYNF